MIRALYNYLIHSFMNVGVLSSRVCCLQHHLVSAVTIWLAWKSRVLVPSGRTSTVALFLGMASVLVMRLG